MRALVLSAALPLFAACGDIAQPFEGPGFKNGEVTTKAEGPFLAATTHLILEDGDEAQKAFDENMEAINAVLLDQPGLVGVSLAGKPFTREYRTLSVWETEEAMLAWVTSEAHATAMADVGDKMVLGRGTHWSIEKDQMPPAWDDAKQRLDGSEPGAY
jgi:heme-degrading monooxygenase HmoA